MSQSDNVLATLPEKYSLFFKLKKGQRGQRPFDYVYYTALDAEWVRRYERNHLLSFQIASCSAEMVSNDLYVVPAGRRPELAEIAAKAIAAVNGGSIPASHHGKRILLNLICHNSVAEYSILDDRDKPAITEAISTVRGSVITLNNTIKLTLPGYCLVEIRWLDTMLLAPAGFRGLKKLSSLLGKESEMKESISQFHIENMDIFMKTDFEGFKQYALKDSEVTLRLFFLLQQSLNELAYRGKFKKLFITIASAAVASFTKENSWHKAYRKQLKSTRLADAIRFVRRSYYGGRGECFLRGRTSQFESTKNKAWLDVDLKGCYPSCAALLPRIDLDGPIKLYLPTYRLDDERVADLDRDNVSAQYIKQARAALAISPQQFERVLKSLPSTVSQRIRDAALVYDNSLLNQWYADWCAAESQPDSELNRCVVPGFARVKFWFDNSPGHTLYPSLLHHHSRFGLVFPLEGETTLTHPELMLALDAGARLDVISSLELPIQRDENGQPIYYMQAYLSRLATERARYEKIPASENPSAQIFDKLLKEFMNSLYGKFSQAVNPRNVCDISTFEMHRQEPSKVTDPIVAALVTGTARAALSSLIYAIERFNAGKPPERWIDVASCTTDGLLVGLPCDEGYSVLGKYYTLKTVKPDEHSDKTFHIPKKVEEVDWSVAGVLAEFDATGLLDEFESFIPLRLFRHARKVMTGKDTYLEIKGMADEVVAVKARGQIGLLRLPPGVDSALSQITILAKFGVKPPLQEVIADPERRKFVFENEALRQNFEGQYLLDHFMATENGRDEIVTYYQDNLPSAGKIVKSKGTMDLIRIIVPRRFNCDFDFKRLPLAVPTALYEGGPLLPPPYTVPFKDLTEMKKHRYQVENIRRSGRVARLAEVVHRVKLRGKTTRSVGGEVGHAVRLLLRGALQGKLQLTGELPPYPELAQRLSDYWCQLPPAWCGSRTSWTVNDVKNATRGAWEPHTVRRASHLVNLVAEVSLIIGIDHEHAATQLFAVEDSTLNPALVAEVTTAVLNGRQVQPFRRLYLSDDLRGRDDLLRAFHPALTPEMLDVCASKLFIPGGRSPHERPQLLQLFRQLGLCSTDAAACATRLIKPADRSQPKSRYVVSNGALEAVVGCVLQPDFPDRPSASWIKRALRRFGLTDGQFSRIQRDDRFYPHRLTDSSRSRAEVRALAKRLKCDAGVIMATVIDPRI
ncbi:MAG: hypothetical protein FDZ69_00220 [Deltaproteobacteria bacterium]|nr:MAG: hypothetical protein FDZ69_00220 [Deltaproteobacteria bacterium]